MSRELDRLGGDWAQLDSREGVESIPRVRTESAAQPLRPWTWGAAAPSTPASRGPTPSWTPPTPGATWSSFGCSPPSFRRPRSCWFADTSRLQNRLMEAAAKNFPLQSPARQPERLRSALLPAARQGASSAGPAAPGVFPSRGGRRADAPARPRCGRRREARRKRSSKNAGRRPSRRPAACGSRPPRRRALFPPPCARRSCGNGTRWAREAPRWNGSAGGSKPWRSCWGTTSERPASQFLLNSVFFSHGML